MVQRDIKHTAAREAKRRSAGTGDRQDSVVTRELLRRLGAEAFVLGENGFSYGRLHALEQSAALEAEARFHREWKKFPAISLKA